MKSLFLSLLLLAAFAARTSAQADKLHVDHDTMYGEVALANDNFVELKNHIVNSGTETVKIRWARIVEQITPGWTTNFCDKNVCYLGGVSSKTFDLFPADTGLLKPIFYTNGIEGCIIYRLDMVSETPGIDYEKSILFLARSTNGCLVLGADDLEKVEDLALWPNPAGDLLTVAFADPGFRGKLEITDARGAVVLRQAAGSATERLDVSRLPAGAYLLRATDAAGRRTVLKSFAKQ